MVGIINAEQAEQAIFETARAFFDKKISGNIYLSDLRPLNAKTEDAVCVVSALDAEQIQTGYAKINVFVADMPAPMSCPNKRRLRELLSLGDDLLKALNQENSGFVFSYQLAPSVLPVHGTLEHIAHFDIKFKCITFNS